MSTETHKPAKPASAAPAANHSAAPVVIDMGSKKRKDVKRLRAGKEGKLMERVQEAIEQLQEDGTISGTAQPIIVVVKERRRNKGLFGIR